MWRYSFILCALVLPAYEATSCLYLPLSKELQCLHANTIDEINAAIDQAFPQGSSDVNAIKEIMISESTLTGLSFDALKVSSHIEHMNIHDCRIDGVASEAFKHLQNLQTLMIYDNNVTEFNIHAFRGLSHLIQLMLLRNDGLHFFDTTFLDDLTELEYLEVRPAIDSNVISNFEELRFEKLNNLKTLTLAYSIKKIPKSVFSHLPNLEELHLSDCHLKEVEDEALHGLPNLKMLDLSTNLLQALPKQLLDHVDKLEVVDLSRNQFKSLPEAVTSFTKVVTLDLSNNQLSELKIKDFENLVHLAALNVEGNELPEETLKQFKQKYSLL